MEKIKSFENFLYEKNSFVNEAKERKQPEEITHTRIIGANLTKARFEGDFSDAVLPGCNFTSTVMEKVDFTNADLSNAVGLSTTASSSTGVPSFYTATWKGANFSGVNFTWLDPTLIKDPEQFFEGCKGIDMEEIKEILSDNEEGLDFMGAARLRM